MHLMKKVCNNSGFTCYKTCFIEERAGGLYDSEDEKEEEEEYKTESETEGEEGGPKRAKKKDDDLVRLPMMSLVL